MTLNKRALLHSTSLAAASAAAWLGLSGLARAADQPAASSSTVGEVVVTAGRREEALQKVPVAVAAVSAAQIETAGVQNFGDLAALTPNLSVITGVGGSNFLNIRGVGIGVSTPFQSAGVPLMSDGLYIPHSEAFLRDAYFDLDHVEVYRGPQGTFAGQNSTGGAIFLVSKQPDFSGTNGFVQQTFADYGWFQTQAAFNMPINDQFAARFAAQYETRNGFTTNAGAGNGVPSQGNTSTTLGNLDNLSLRGILRWKPRDNLDIRLRYDYLRQADNGQPAVRSPTPGTFNNPHVIATPRIVYEDFVGSDISTINRVTFNVDWHINNDVELKSITGFQQWNSAGVADSDASSPYRKDCLTAAGAPIQCQQGFATTQQNDTYYNQEFDLISTSASKLQWVLGAAALKQDTPIHNYNAAYCFDPNVLAAPANQGGIGGGTNACNAGLYATYPNAYAVTIATGPGSKLDYLQSSHSEAIFGEAKYQFNDQWQLIAGGRFTWFHIQLNPGSAVLYNGNFYNANAAINSAYLNAYPGYGGPVVNSQWIVSPGRTDLQTCGNINGNAATPNLCILQAQATFSAPTGRVVLNWTPTPKTTAYASWSKGFKQGSYVTQFTVGAAGPQSQYKQEDIYNYEVGLKTSLLDNHIKLNADVFYEDYYNWQASFRVTASPIPRSVNIDKSRIMGFEAQAEGVWGDFRTNLSVGYDDSKVVKNSNLGIVPANEYGPGAGIGGPVPSGITTVSCSTNNVTSAVVPGGPVPGVSTAVATGCLGFVGSALNFSPKWNASLTAQYDFHVLNGVLTPFVEWTYSSDQWDQLFHASQDYIPQHQLVNLRIAYTAPEHWRVEGFATNVLNTLYVQGVAAGSGATPYSTLLSIGAPRQMGVRVRYAF